MIFLISLIEMIHNNQINHLNHSSDNSIGGTLQHSTIRRRRGAKTVQQLINVVLKDQF